MKIGIVCYPTHGGSGVLATELGKYLSYQGHQVCFIAYQQPTRLDDIACSIHYHQVVIEKYPLFKYPPYELALTSKMIEVVKQEKLDILHAHYAIPHASSALLAKQILQEEGINIPIVTTLHGTDITLVGNSAHYAPIISHSINHSDGVTAVSESLKQDTFDFFTINRSIKVIPNFIDLNRFQRHPKEHFKKAICPQNEKLLVHISNFRKVKRVKDVVKIFQIVNQKIKSKLMLIGDGPEMKIVKNLCRDLRIIDHILFIGSLEKIEEALSVCDLFILPSEKESFGLAALEAMACQVPIITSNIGGLLELNINGQTGFSSAVGDIKSMAKHALHILKDKHLPIFRKGALKRAKQFDIKTIVPIYESYYQEIMTNINVAN